MSGDPIFSEEQLEAARVLFAGQASFMMGAVKMDGLPEADMPEVCFAGRSNVGKSSLINALVGHKKLARASNEPGRTREINFFDLAGKIRLVDLPGYGFARVSRQAANKFQDLGRQYLRGRPNLKRVYLLIDARHGLKEVDKEALDALDVSAVSYQIVLTKADKIKPAEAAALVVKTQTQIAKRPAAFPRVLATSAEKGDGLPELRAEIQAVCEV
ncbi:MAG: YihA family ribosome biogenesis GTP-binding protein [Caulobacter sp.]|nr:YihA family ribosome biogenesis GTP-binding protein [Caulobacter sp.]